MTETHQQIKDRLFKTASTIWGLQGPQTEAAFDPLVGMLLGACATELGKISHEINETRSRTLERLVKLLYPEVLVNALPAHAIAYAYPSEEKVLLNNDAQFYYQKKIAGVSTGASASWKNIFFAPAGNFVLHQATIKFMATAGTLYAINDNLYKEPLTTRQLKAGQNTFQHSVWLGIENIEALNNETSFYFELRNEVWKNIFFDYLPFTKWYANETVLDSAPFFGKSQAISGKPEPAEIISGKTSTIKRIVKQINKFYAGNFITVTRLSDKKTKKGLPEELEKLHAGQAALKTIKSDVGWIRIDFPENINIAQLQDDLFISLNCFPVLNLQLLSAQQKLMDHINVFPLASEDYFLDIAEITDTEGNILDGFGKQETEPLISLHYGGVERFNEKNAMEVIEGLIQQLRDESVAYSNIGNDFLNTELKSLKQSLNKLEQQIEEKQITKGDTPYLLIGGKNKMGTSNVFVKYWTASGQDGNDIRPGTALALYKNASIMGNTAKLITATTGGRNMLGSAEKVLAYKTAILSKEKLVTAEDIASFCRLRLGITDVDVRVEKGFMVQGKNNGGFVKTIDVTLELPESEKKNLEAGGGASYWEKDLVFAITENSSFFMPLRVFIKYTSEVSYNF